MNLEYFISSLPMIAEDQPAKISPEVFLQSCREQLDGALAKAAAEMLGERGQSDEASGQPVQSRHAFVTAWRDRENQLRNAIALERAKRLPNAPRPAARETTGFDASIASGVSAAFSGKDPLARELALDSIRWRLLDEMQGVSPFSEATVLAYAGKLALNARRFSFDAAKGMDRFTEMTA